MHPRVGWSLLVLGALISGSGKANREPVTELQVAAARRQAELLHTLVHATLHNVHERDDRENEGLPLPAAALREVFSVLEKEHEVTLRWLAVDGEAMNTDHRATTDFEKQAVAALRSGQASFEAFDEKVYRRAAAVTLKNQCLKCHFPQRRSTADRQTGLIATSP